MKTMRILLALLMLLMIGGIGNLTLTKCSHDEEETADGLQADSAQKEPAVDPLEALLDSLLDSDDAEGDTTENSEAEVAVPAFVKRWLGGTECWAETICTTGGLTYYKAWADDNITHLIYDNHRVIVGGPLLMVTPIDSTSDRRCIVTMCDLSTTVDFGSKASVSRLSAFGAVLPQFTRYRIDTLTNIGYNVRFALELDFPVGHSANELRIKKWLVDHLFSENDVGRGSLPFYIINTRMGWDRWKYKGDMNDYRRIAGYAAAVYFSEKKDMSPTNAIHYPLEPYLALSYRARVSNGRFVTYQEITNEYCDGIHGYYTERLLSYDVENQREIDWDYLFKPGSTKAVEELFFSEALKDRRFEGVVEGSGSQEENAAALRSHIEGWIHEYTDSTATFQLPPPALGEQGVVFSFQPYEIGCFADGAFHFTIPYAKLKAYLTDQARRCLKQ